jgi:hypothetical protein
MSTSDHSDRLGLERFDAVEAPDQWADIVRRSSASDSTTNAATNVVAMRRGRGWYLAAAASFVALIGGLVVVTQLRDDDGAAPIDRPVNDPTECAGESDLDAIAELLSSGLPVYDYQPAADLTELIDRNDVVIRAEITSAVHIDGANDDYTAANDGDTAISIGAPTLLIGETTETIEGFATSAQWPEGAGPDPLADSVAFDGLDVIAFLTARDEAPFGWYPDIEGLIIACGDGPATSMIEAAPFLDLTSLDALETQITGVGPVTTTTTEPATTDGSSPTATPNTVEVDDTVPEAAVDERWSPTCVDQFRSGDAATADSGLDEFGPLGAVPGLDIALPIFQSTAQAAPAAVNVALGRVDGGTVVLARPYEGDVTNVYILSVVDDSGSVRWRRCSDGAFAGSMLSSPGADMIIVAEYTPGTNSDAPVWHVFDVATGLDAAPLDIPDELQTVTVNGRYALFTSSGERLTTAADEMALLDLTSGELTTIPYPDVTDVPAFQFDFQIVDRDNGGFRILQRTFDNGVAVGSVWVDGAWHTDAATILEATPIRAVDSFDERGWEGRDGLGEVVWSRTDLLDIRQEGFLSDVSETVTIINGCLEQAEGGCGRGSLFGIDTTSGDTLWERSGLRGVSAVGDGFAIITNDAGDGWEMIDTLTGELVDESQRWNGIEPFEQQCCGGGDFVWVGREGGVVFAVNQDHVRVWYPQGRAGTTINTSLTE